MEIGRRLYLAWPYLGACLLTVVAMAPPITYLVRGLPVKRKQAINNFDPITIRFYFARFWVTRPTIVNGRTIAVRDLEPDHSEKSAALVASLEQIFDEYFGRGLYVLPLGLLACVLFISATFGLQFQANMQPTSTADFTMTAAAAGGYLWVVSDGISRMRLNDYLPSDVYSHVLRITIAIPVGLALSTIAKDAVGPLIAFGAGTFPIETITRILRATVAKGLGTTDDPDTDGDEIKRLVGINNDVAQRLMAEGVATILALCKCDPIRIMMRTNLDFEVVLDLVDQALVAAYFAASDRNQADKLLDILRQAGLGRASQVSALMRLVDEKNETAIDLKNSLSPSLGVSTVQIQNVLTTIAVDQRTDLICKLKYFEKLSS